MANDFHEQQQLLTVFCLIFIRYDLNMYNMICRIRWKYDCGPDEVSGCILGVVLYQIHYHVLLNKTGIDIFLLSMS